MVGVTNCCIQYTVLFNFKFIVNLIVQFGFTKDVIFLEGAHHFPITGYL